MVYSVHANTLYYFCTRILAMHITCCCQFYYQLLYSEIQVKCLITFPQSTVCDRRRRRAT